MGGAPGRGGLQIEGIQMRKFEKKYFDTYSDAEIWMLNTTKTTDGVIRKENGKYYVFIEQETK